MLKLVLAKYKTRSPILSKFGLTCALLFLIYVFLGRLLFPFGDEPDFIVRASALVFDLENAPFWSPYRIFESIFGSLNINTGCIILGTPLSLWESINADSCSENIEQILRRFFGIIIITSPLIYFVVFRFSSRIFLLNSKKDDLSLRLDALSITLTFPSIIYYISLISHEQLSLIFSLFLILTWNSISFSLILVYLVYLVDSGNSMILLVFLILGKGGEILNSRYGKKYFILAILIILSIAFSLSFTLLNLVNLDIIGLDQKTDALVSSYSDGVGSTLINKYPIYLRPVITYMSFIMLTPAYIKSIFAYILSSVCIFTAVKKSFSQKNKIFTNEGVLTITTISTILFFIFLFPSYVDAKYYIFMLPFLIMSLLKLYEKNLVLIFSSILSLIVFIQLFLYRL